eukprot:3138807-Lingulodinium_polyedra.AAC.1
MVARAGNTRCEMTYGAKMGCYYTGISEYLSRENCSTMRSTIHATAAPPRASQSAHSTRRRHTAADAWNAQIVQRATLQRICAWNGVAWHGTARHGVA